MKIEKSKRWKLNVRDLVDQNEFTGVFVFDSKYKDSVMMANGKIEERKGENELDLTPRCDFCGSHRRYVSVIEATSMNGIMNYKVGVDCLAMILGQNDPLVQNISRNVRQLAKAAKARKTREKNLIEFAEELPILEDIVGNGYGQGVIRDGYHYIISGKDISEAFASYLRRSIEEVKHNFVTYRNQISVLKTMVDNEEAGNFERDMFYALIQGRNISPKMESIIDRIVEQNHPQRVLERREALKSINVKVDKLVGMIKVVDANLIGRPIAGQYTSYDTIVSIQRQLNSKKFITPKQVNKINSVYAKVKIRYEKKMKKS